MVHLSFKMDKLCPGDLVTVVVDVELDIAIRDSIYNLSPNSLASASLIY